MLRVLEKSTKYAREISLAPQLGNHHSSMITTAVKSSAQPGNQLAQHLSPVEPGQISA
jgi:hypothetical protein